MADLLIRLFRDPPGPPVCNIMADFTEASETAVSRVSITPGHGTGPKARAWVFTLNNYTDEECAAVEAEAQGALRLLVGKEIAPTTGTPHLQGYIRFKNPVRFAALKKRHPRANFHIAKGNDSQNFQYTSKESLWLDHGVNNDHPEPAIGRQEETDMIIEKIEQGATYGQIRQAHKRFCFWYRRHVMEYITDEKKLLNI